jgi:ABC-type uncharacterized transport system substrate-binding protein
MRFLNPLSHNRKSKICTAFDKLRPRACRGELNRSIRNLRWLTLGTMLFALSVPAGVQQPGKVPRIGLLMSASSAETATRIEAFRQSLRELGYVEGKNIAIEHRFAEGKIDRLPDLAAELVRLEVDIIVVTGGIPAVRAAKQATSTIPIVMLVGFDPVEAGFVTSLARPGGNITGLTSITRELIGKRLELLLEAVPGIKRVGVLVAQIDPARFMARDESKEMEAAARVLGVKLQILKARDPSAIENAFSAMTKERAEALVVIPEARYVQHRERLLKHAAKNRLPSIYPSNEFVENGGLMSYGANTADQYRRSAT